MAVLEVTRTARKRYRCAQCDGAIEPGQQYVDSALTPYGELGYEKWQHAKYHLPAEHMVPQDWP